MSPMLAEKPPVLNAQRRRSDQPRLMPVHSEEYEKFGNVETRNGLQARVEVPLLLRALRLPLGGRVLEIGCGRGVALPVLADGLLPRELMGVDIDPSLLDAAQARLRSAQVRATLVEADIRDLPIESSSFDIVIDFGTCYHVSGGEAGSLEALREVARVLRPGGLFVHETRVAQHLAHPVRSFGRTLPWAAVPQLVRDRAAVLWGVRRKTAIRSIPHEQNIQRNAHE